MEKKIVILGAIGKTARQNRDDMRVLGGGGYSVYPEISHRQGSAISGEKI